LSHIDSQCQKTKARDECWLFRWKVETTPPSLPVAVGRWQPPGEQTVSDEWGRG